MSEMFEEATRRHVKFNAGIGMITAEDLWDLPLKSPRGPSLYPIATALHNELKRDVPDFLDDAERPDSLTQLKFDVVRHVIEFKKAEVKAASEARDKAEKRQQIMAIIADKQVGELKEKSVEDLRALLASL